VVEPPRRALRLAAAGDDGERPGVPAARRGDAPAARPQLRADVGERDVVRRVVGPLPDEDGPRRVGDALAAEDGADAFAARLDADPPAAVVRPGAGHGHARPLSVTAASS